MKKTIFYTVVMMLWPMSISLYAQNSIDAQLQAIHNAPASKRVEMMNQFKQRLAQMNEQERSEAIAQMRTQMQKQQHKQEHMDGNKERRLDQMEHSENMQRMEQMQQRQHGQQQMKEQMGEHQSGHNGQQEMPNMPYK